MEFTLSSSLDAYVKTQLNSGRLDANKLKKVADAWTNKGRPRVVGFRYDLETQIELVQAHVREFRFYGSRQVDEAAISGLLHAMKTNARAMRVRTFCQPDPVIAKQILDSQALLALLGSPESQQISLAEVSQFFKVVIERQRAIREQRERCTSSTRTRQHGQADGSWMMQEEGPAGGLDGYDGALVPDHYGATPEKLA